MNFITHDKYGNTGLTSIYIVNVVSENQSIDKSSELYPEYEKEHIRGVMSELGVVSRVDIVRKKLTTGNTQTSAFVYFSYIYPINCCIHTNPSADPMRNPIKLLVTNAASNPKQDIFYDMPLENCYWRLRINKNPRYTIQDQLACAEIAKSSQETLTRCDQYRIDTFLDEFESERTVEV